MNDRERAKNPEVKEDWMNQGKKKNISNENRSRLGNYFALRI